MRFYFKEQLSENKYITPEGFLLCKDVVIARTGIQIYTADEMPHEPDGNGLIHVYRSPEEVFKPESIASYSGKPFVINHPTIDGELIDVTPENWRDLSCGSVLNPRRGSGIFNDKLIADILVTDAFAIELIKSKKKKEVSCGYDADYIEDGPGKANQINIIGNHVALVDDGRCGPICKINDNAPTVKRIGKKEKIMAGVDWIKEIIAKSHKARDADELKAVQDEALAHADSLSEGGDHTHIHLHSGTVATAPAGDKEMTTTETGAGAAVKKPVEETMTATPTDDAKKMKDDVAALQKGHQMLSNKLDMICEALGITGAEGEEPENITETETGDRRPKRDAAVLGKGPHYNYPEDRGIYSPGDYSEGEFVEFDKLGALSKNKPLDFEMEAPPGTSGATFKSVDGRLVRRRQGDAGAALKTRWEAIVADAEIILPGVRIPTVDARGGVPAILGTMSAFQRRVLQRVYEDADLAPDLENLIGNIEPRRMTADAVSTTFRALAAMYRDRNNRATFQITPGSFSPSNGAKPISSISDYQKKINEMAENTWGTGGTTR